MARKEPPKPMFDLRHDFVASLENLCQQSLMMLQAVEAVVKDDKLNPAVRSVLQERVAALRAALTMEE